MSDQCTKVRITEVGGLAGTIPRPPRVDLTRSSLDQAQSQSMDEACRQLLTLAGSDPKAASPPAQVGADIHGYLVEIEAKPGEKRTFTIPYRRRQGSALERADINDVIKQLENLSPSPQ